MKIALSKIESGRTEFEIDWPAGALVSEEDPEGWKGLPRPLDRIKGRIVIKPLSEPVEEADFLVEGRIETKVGGECDRCLKEFVRSVDLEFRVILVRNLGEELPERELRGEELNHSLLEGQEIDLKRIVLEQLILDSDMVNLCSPECLGLCPFCGADLNENGCDCKNDEIDPRLAKLAHWRPDKN